MNPHTTLRPSSGNWPSLARRRRPRGRPAARDRLLLGDPGRVADEIARYGERLGVTTLIVRVQWPRMAPPDVLRSIRLLGEQVLPRLRPA